MLQSKMKNLIVSVLESEFDKIVEHANKRNMSITLTIRRALAIFIFIDEQLINGNRILIDDGLSLRELHIV